MNPYVYIVVRKDIKPCNYAPQIAHAALESGYQSEEPESKTHIVILQVATKGELEYAAFCLSLDEVPYEEFHEGYSKMGLTALATLPSTEHPKCLKGLSLFNFTPEKEMQVSVEQDRWGNWYITDMPVLENDPNNSFVSRSAAVDFYNTKFG